MNLSYIKGNTNYELATHTSVMLSTGLGNVIAVVSDRLFSTETFSGSGIVDHYSADIVSSSDYYPFGSLMPGRSFSSNQYRFGFNGMEKDDELKGNGNSYTTEFRQYDSRIGRWLSQDPVTHEFQSPYCAFDNNPICLVDPMGSNSNLPDKKVTETSSTTRTYDGNGKHTITTTNTVTTTWTTFVYDSYNRIIESRIEKETETTTYQTVVEPLIDENGDFVRDEDNNIIIGVVSSTVKEDYDYSRDATYYGYGFLGGRYITGISDYGSFSEEGESQNIDLSFQDYRTQTASRWVMQNMNDDITWSGYKHKYSDAEIYSAGGAIKLMESNSILGASTKYNTYVYMAVPLGITLGTPFRIFHESNNFAGTSSTFYKSSKTYWTDFKGIPLDQKTILDDE